MASKKNEVAVSGSIGGEYEIMRTSHEEIAEFVQGLRGVKITDLQKITTPPVSGGGTPRWVVDDQMVEELVGIPIFHRYVRVYWPAKMGEDPATSGGPPACRSGDQDTGLGVRFDGDDAGPHDCASCPHAQFGTRGRAQACKERMIVVLIRPDSILPSILDLPVSSLKLTKALFIRLTAQRNVATGGLGKPWMAEIGWRLNTAQNKDAIKYNTAIPRKVRDLDHSELGRVAEMVRDYKAIFGTARVEEMTTHAGDTV